MRKAFLILVGLLAVTPCWAAKIYLNSGSVIEGKIVETGSDSVKIDVGGVPVTYYKDEIARLEGDDAAAMALGLDAVASSPAPEASAPAASVPDAATPSPVAVDPVPASAVSSQKKDMILKFIDVFGTRQAMISNFAQMLSALPADQAEKLRGIFSVDAIIEELVPVYDKHFSEAELAAFISFYSSAEGSKLVATIPQIMKESVDVSAKYFEARMPEDLKNLPAPQQK